MVKNYKDFKIAIFSFRANFCCGYGKALICEQLQVLSCSWPGDAHSTVMKDSVSLFCSTQTGSSLRQDKAGPGPAMIAEPGATIIVEPGTTTVDEPGATVIA